MSEGSRDRSDILVSNERVKVLSGTFVNLGAALIAAVAARLYVNEGLDRTTLLWSIGAIGIIWLGWKLLYLLQAESTMTLSPEMAQMAPGIMAIALSVVGFIGMKIVEYRRARARTDRPRP